MIRTNYTNNYDYPDLIVDAVKKFANEYDGNGENSISVTSLIDSPRINILKRTDGIVDVDVSEMLWILMGQAMHSILEKGSSRCLTEVRLDLDIYSTTLTGKLDYYDYNKKELSDWKITSKYASREPKKEWVHQLNILKYLAERKLGIEVVSLKNHLILRDWNPKDKYDNNMPDRNFVTIDIPIASTEVVENYIEERIKSHTEAERAFLKGEGLPICTNKEKWVDLDWIITKDGVRAYRKFDKLDDAKEFYSEMKNKDDYSLIKRESEPKRCTSYCSVRTICPYALSLKDSII